MGQGIGYGSFGRPNREQFKEDLRNRFLEAVNRNRQARRVLQDLYGEPFKLYLEAGLGVKLDDSGDHLDADQQARKNWRAWNRHLWSRANWQDKFECGLITYNSRKEALRKCLFEWSRRSYLDAAWCRECAYNTLDHWAYSRPDRERLQFQPLVKAVNFFSMGGGAKGLRRRFIFEYVIVHPQIKFLDETEAEIREAFDHELKAAFNDLKRRAKASGCEPTPQTYESKYRKHYYRWLVERAINKKPIKTIAEETKDRDGSGGPDYKTVRDAVNLLAEDIELPLTHLLRKA